MKTLFLIPARGGSKGIPHKNIKPLGGRPLIHYSIDCARALADDCDICVSTDDPAIIKVVENYGLKVPFVRPEVLSGDTVGSYEVILHALDFYAAKGIDYDRVILLQPTSPFRTPEDVAGAAALYDDSLDMVVSVCRAATNPYYDAFECDADGYLRVSKGDGHYPRRQDAPEVWEYNGAVYVINARALRQRDLSDMTKVVKYVMPRDRSLDLDTPLDWKIAETLLSESIPSDRPHGE